MWLLDYKAGWAPKNCCFWTVVLEKTLQSPLDCKEIQSVHSKVNQSWIFIEKTDAEAETPIVWLVMRRTDSLKKTGSGKVWRWEEKGTTEDEMVGWHHWLNRQEVCKTSGSWWWTGKPGVLQTCDRRVTHNWATELSWTDVDIFIKFEEQCRCIKIY